jgi:hypothetical protein
MRIAEAIARRGIRKRYYLETRGDVLLRNKEVFKLWKRLGLNTMFLGLEAIDEEGLKRYRKRDLPPPSTATVERDDLYIHTSSGRKGRQIDHHTEEFVNATRTGTAV